MQKNRIEVSSKLKKDLAAQHETSLTSVQLSLDYYNNSDKAKKIRQGAKELLLKEIEKITLHP